MISFKIVQRKDFMNKLLKDSDFDNFLCSELSIHSFVNFSVDGHINASYYTDEEREELQDTQYTPWHDIKPLAFQMISGKKTPLSMKIVLLLNKANTQHVLQSTGLPMTLKDINGLFINIRYDHGQITLTTGTSLSLFTMDKSLEQSWDGFVKKFLLKHEIDFEQT